MIKRRKPSSPNHQKQTQFKCDGWSQKYNSILHFRQHVQQSHKYRACMPCCCQFCTYISYGFSGLQRHLSVTPHCAHFYKEKEAIAGIIPDLCTGQLRNKSPNPQITYYTFEQYPSNGVCDNVQLNITDDTAEKLKSVSNIYGSTNTYMKQQSSYMDNTRK